MKKFKNIIIHHSKTKDGITVSWDNIRKYHVNNLGWLDIGYNYGIEKIDDGFEVLVGRSLLIDGAHTKGRNKDSIGICFIGDFDEAAPDDEMIKRGAILIKDLMYIFNIKIENIYTHNHFANYKTCPGELFPMDKLKDLLK